MLLGVAPSRESMIIQWSSVALRSIDNDKYCVDSEKMQEHLSDISDIDAFYQHVDSGLPVSVDVVCKQPRQPRSCKSETCVSDYESKHRITRGCKDGISRLNVTPNDRKRSKRPTVGSPCNTRPIKNVASGELSKAMDNLMEICEQHVEISPYLDTEMNDLTGRMRNMMDYGTPIDPKVDRHSSDSNNDVALKGIHLVINEGHALLDYDSDCSSIPSYSGKYDFPNMEDTSCMDPKDLDDDLNNMESPSQVPSALQITVIESEDGIEIDSSTMPSVSLDDQVTPLGNPYISEGPECNEVHEPIDDSGNGFLNLNSASNNSHGKHTHKCVLTSEEFYDCSADEWSLEPFQSVETDHRYRYKIGLMTASSCLSSDTEINGSFQLASVELIEELGIEVSDLLSHITKEEIVSHDRKEKLAVKTKQITMEDCKELYESCVMDRVFLKPSDGERFARESETLLSEVNCIHRKGMQSNELNSILVIQTFTNEETFITAETQTETTPTIKPCRQESFENDARTMTESENPKTEPRLLSTLSFYQQGAAVNDIEASVPLITPYHSLMEIHSFNDTAEIEPIQGDCARFMPDFVETSTETTSTDCVKCNQQDVTSFHPGTLDEVQLATVSINTSYESKTHKTNAISLKNKEKTLSTENQIIIPPPSTLPCNSMEMYNLKTAAVTDDTFPEAEIKSVAALRSFWGKQTRNNQFQLKN